MIRDKYAKVYFDDGVVHIIPAWGDSMTNDELIEHAIKAGLDYGSGVFTITIVYT